MKNQVQFVWRWGKDKSAENLNSEIIGYKTEDGEYRIVQKMRHNEKIIRSLLLDKAFSSRRGTAEVEVIFGAKYFSFPKPVELIKQFIQIATNDNDIILDFFSGSATTAHAVMQLNAEDGGNRRFIMVQLPEVTDEKSEAFKAGYKNICEIGKERIRRAGTKIKQSYLEHGQEYRDITRKEKEQPNESIVVSDAYWVDSPEYREENEKIANSIDTGFRVLKLDTSNLVAWDSTPTKDLDDLFTRFDARDKTIKPDRSDMDIVYEVMLKMGIPLDFVVSEITVGKRKCYSIGEKVYEGIKDCLILVCLDRGITPEDVTAMCDLAPAKIVAAEESFEDSSVMSNAHYILKDRNIEMKLL